MSSKREMRVHLYESPEHDRTLCRLEVKRPTDARPGKHHVCNFCVAEERHRKNRPYHERLAED